jgi:hypothetical protein
MFPQVRQTLRCFLIWSSTALYCPCFSFCRRYAPPKAWTLVRCSQPRSSLALCSWAQDRSIRCSQLSTAGPRTIPRPVDYLLLSTPLSTYKSGAARRLLISHIASINIPFLQRTGTTQAFFDAVVCLATGADAQSSVQLPPRNGFPLRERSATLTMLSMCCHHYS